MSSRRLATIFKHGINGHVVSTSSGRTPEPPDDGLIRVLVLDEDPQTIEIIENALWVWPHRVSRAGSLNEATSMCRHLTPAAIVVSLESPENAHGRLVSDLRHANSNVPIIAIGSVDVIDNPGPILRQGANAIVSYENLQQSTLHDLLIQLQHAANAEHPDDEMEKTQLPFPWCDSDVFGSIICNINGKITGANKRLAVLLGYPHSETLLGMDVRHDLLSSSDDWDAWTAIAGDTKTILRQSLSVKMQNNQLRFMISEVFAAPHSPTSIQAVFVDLTELV